MRRFRGVQKFLLLAAVAAAYYLIGRLSLQLAFVHPSASPVWPPSGIAIALVLLLSVRVWPAIFLGAFFVNLATEGTLLTSLGIAAGNTLEALLGSMLVWRYAHGHDALMRVQHLFRFVVLAALLSTMVSASVGTATLFLGGFALAQQTPTLWLTWWLGDAAGVLLVTPLILSWSTRNGVRPKLGDLGEAALLGAALVLVSQVEFGELVPFTTRGYPLVFLCIPFLLWAALRFAQRGATTAIALLAALAVFGNLRGFGPFAAYPTNESLLLLQAYMGVMAVTALMVAAVVGERREIEDRLRRLAVSDPLTGLANYRMLVDRLHAEIARANRSGKPLVVLFLDLDGLKRINDLRGHITGNRALLRLAHVLKESCRSADLVARFGGDEFVVVMPESDQASAAVLVRRIVARLEHSTEQPALTISSGVAVHPRDGASPEELLKTADARLYATREKLRMH